MINDRLRRLTYLCAGIVSYCSAAKTRRETKLNAFNTYCVMCRSQVRRFGFVFILMVSNGEKKKKNRIEKKKSSTTQFAFSRAVVPNSRVRMYDSESRMKWSDFSFYGKSTFSILTKKIKLVVSEHKNKFFDLRF